MFLIYDLIFIIFSAIYLPLFILKRKFHSEFFMRLGLMSKDYLNSLKGKRPIWVHAVSVGEMNAVKSLIESLRKEYPHTNLVISTVTKTANTLARSIAKDNDKVIFLPLDLSFIVKRVVSLISPSLFITVETEIWPNLIFWLNKNKIPIILVNGRISLRSFKRYRIVKFLLRNILKRLSLFCMQTEKDKERILFLGAPKEKVFMTGNMKFDISDYTDLERNYTGYREKLGLTDENLIIAGSTHPGEEEILLEVYKRLQDDFKNLKFLIAPRHPERTKDIEKIITKFGFNPMRVSQLNKQTDKSTNQRIVFILDTIGELTSFYAISDIVFMGGSLIKKGGHNLIEPAFFGKPIIFGPNIFNFQDICDLFLKNGAAIKVRDNKDLFLEIKNLLKNPYKRKEIGMKARDLVLKNRGATQKNIDLIKSFLII